MTTYDVSKLTDAKILADKPISQGQGRALRDNLLAVIEGDASAPRIELGALNVGSDVDGAFTNGSTAPSAPGVYDYESFTLSTPKTFPNYSIIRVQGDFTLSSILTIAPVLAADYPLLEALGAIRGNDGSFVSPVVSGGGSIGSGGHDTGYAYGAGINLNAASRLWALKRGLIGGLGGINGGVSRAGGALVLIVGGNCNLTGGTIDASAAAVTAGTRAGGGGGGSVMIVCREALTAGTLKANGADGAPTQAGAGGGGLIWTAAASYPIGQTLQVNPGTNSSFIDVAPTIGAVVQETLTAAHIFGLLFR